MVAGTISPVAMLRDARKRSSESDSILVSMFSGPCQTPRKQANARKEHPRLGAGDRFLEIFREPSAAVEPSNCSLNHPSLGLRLERANALGACGYLDGPLPELRERFEQL